MPTVNTRIRAVVLQICNVSLGCLQGSRFTDQRANALPSHKEHPTWTHAEHTLPLESVLGTSWDQFGVVFGPSWGLLGTNLGAILVAGRGCIAIQAFRGYFEVASQRASQLANQLASQLSSQVASQVASQPAVNQPASKPAPPASQPTSQLAS